MTNEYPVHMPFHPVGHSGMFVSCNEIDEFNLKGPLSVNCEGIVYLRVYGDDLSGYFTDGATRDVRADRRSRHLQ